MQHFTRQMFRSSIVFGVVFGAACEPTTVSDAREQLGRGGARLLEYTVPIADTTLRVQTLFDAEGIVLDTTPEGLLAVRSNPESLTVAVGETLRFSDVNTDSMVVSFDPVVFTGPPGSDISFDTSYDAAELGLRFPGIDTTVIHTGALVLTTESRITADVSYEVTLNGFTGPGGAPLRQAGVIAAAPGDGSYEESEIIFNLSGVTIVPGAVRVDVSGEATLGPAMNPAHADSAVIQSGQADLTLSRLVGTPDPDDVPELAVAVQEMAEVPSSSLDFHEFGDAVRDSRLNDARLQIFIDNEVDLPANSSDLTIGLVQLDPFGSVPRDESGEIVYEADSLGAPILVPVADSGSTAFTVARSSTGSLVLPAAELVNRLVNLLLDDVRVALVTSGTVLVGDGNAGSASRADLVAFIVDVVAILDLTLPSEGVTFTRNTVQDGFLSLNADDADNLTERVERAAVITDVVNQTPFGLQLDIAFVEGELPSERDVFSEPGRVLLSDITVLAPAVDANGRAIEATSAAVEIELIGPDIRPLLSERFTAAVRVRLAPGNGANGRGAIGAIDRIMLDSRAQIQLRAGGS